MPETVILNERVGWDEDIQDSIAPDYGFPNKRANTRVFAKAPGGQPFSRETQNAGHTLTFSWLNRSYECVQRIRRFVEQYEDGFFTIVDWDGGGRHYVGRFTGECAPAQKGNDRYDITDLTFEEVPGAPMLQYPSDWDRDSIQLRVANDYGRQNLATSGTWTPGVTPAFKTLDSAGTAGDFATMEYRGYGFQLWMQMGPAYGIVQVLLDDATVNASLDLYAEAALGPQLVLTQSQVPLDLHRVKVFVTGNKNAAATAAGASWCMLQVMR